MVRMKTILHPTDFSEPSKYALEYAAACAREFGAKLYFLHVVPDVPVPGYWEAAAVPTTVAMMEEVAWGARKALEKLLPPEVRGTIVVECLVRQGVAFVEIIRCAVEIKADLIVCGTHGRTVLQHAIIGSVAENVVRKSPCPVLSVRHPEHKFEMPA